jgi:hypothetical protein
MTEHNPKPSKFLRIGFVVIGITSMSGLGCMITIAIERIAAGRGLEVYRTFWLVEGNWVEFLVFLIVLVVAFLVALVFQIREYLLWRELERKYGSAEEKV